MENQIRSYNFARKNFLRYLVASKDLKSGSILSLSDIEVKRVTPGDYGLEPSNLNKIIGKKTQNSKTKNQIFKKEDVF